MPFFEESFLFSASEADLYRRMKLSAVLRHMQDAAGRHLDSLGYSYEKLMEKHQVFLLSKMEILFENEERIVCIKEPGLLSEEAPGKASLPALLQAHTGGAVFPVHRLDRETGGVMVYAKTAREAARLSRLVQENRLEKIQRSELLF